LANNVVYLEKIVQTIILPRDNDWYQNLWDGMGIDVGNRWRVFLGDIQDRIIDGNTSCEDPSYPHREIYPMLFDLSNEKGTLVIAVLFASRVVKDSICSKSSSNLSIFKQPERMRVCRDFNL